jgi:hypothetical protein
MPKYEIAPHDVQGPFSEDGEDEGPKLESIETTHVDGEGEFNYFQGYSARQMAERHARESGGTIYVNSISRKIVGKHVGTNAPIYYAVADAPVYTLIRKDGKIVRAYWPVLT